MKILIIKLGALGDIIIATSVIKQILDQHENDDVTLLTTPAFENIFHGFNSLRVTGIDRKGLINSLKTIYWIRTQKFERIYDLQSNDRTSLYCTFSGCDYCAGNHPRHPYKTHPENKYIGQCHSFERLNEIIKSTGLQEARSTPYLPIPEDAINRIDKWITDKELSGKNFILLHAGSSPKHLKKRWPHFSELAFVIGKKLDIVWVGGKDDFELNKRLSREIGIDATNEFNIFELVELGKRAKFAITNDSAPMHILSCSNIPVFGLFGPTYARRTHALGQIENAITANNKIANNDYEFKPEDISLITVDQVLLRLDGQGLI